MAVLVDNQAYFAAAKATLLRAGSSILLLGWMLDPRTRLVPGSERAGQPDTIGALLNALARERPQLDIRVLIWKAALPVSGTRDLFPHRAKLWLDESIHLHLDETHPPGACHHQKLLVVDDEIAFCSGGDFGTNRWDMPAHRDSETRRRLPSGRMYEPRHGMTMMVDGPAARMLADLARERWRAATGERLAAPSAAGTGDHWPEHVEPLLTDLPVAAARTSPAWGASPAIRECEALYLRAIAAARDSIYLENQYFASPRIGDALAARLAEPNGPEIVVICSPFSPSYFDRLVMDAARDALVARLNAADRYGRFRAYGPHAPGGRGIIVHSKIMIVDDRFVRVGSSNLNNRSMAFDTECDLAVDADLTAEPADTRGRVRRVRSGLVAHWLGSPARCLEQRLAERGSMIAAIESLDCAQQPRLRPLRPKGAGAVGSLSARHHLGDPVGTGDAWRPWRRRAGPARAPWLALAVAAGTAALATYALLRGRSRSDTRSAGGRRPAHATMPVRRG